MVLENIDRSPWWLDYAWNLGSYFADLTDDPRYGARVKHIGELLCVSRFSSKIDLSILNYDSEKASPVHNPQPRPRVATGTPTLRRNPLRSSPDAPSRERNIRGQP